MQRQVARVLRQVQTPEGDGMVVRRAFPTQQLGRLDPFLVLDEMGPLELPPASRAGFPDHPHRGFETVTYVLDGEFEHRDSHGNAGRLAAGDVQWMTAGAGVVHSEMPSRRLQQEGGRLHGFQLWVNLPRRDKMMAPRYQEIKAERIPVARVPGATVRIVAGSFAGQEAVIDTRTPIQYLHASVEAGAAVDLPAPEGHAGLVLVFGGKGRVGGQGMERGTWGILGGQGTQLRVEADEALELLLITGVPLGEPVFQYGPFVMTTRDEILQAIEDYNAGRFGSIPPAKE
jgi:quercetin 2,3-dioxygenase